jgi:glycosyltransferase involved in cell wall biosynthesis
MKVCFVNVNMYSLFNPGSQAPVGGTEVQLFNIARYLSKKNEVRVITGDWGQTTSKEIYGRIKVYKSFNLKKTLKNYFIAPFILWQKMKQIKADVYIASSASLEVGLISFFCRIYGKKFIYRTAHEKDCNGVFKDKNKLAGFIYEIGLKNADVVVTQNQDNQKMLFEKYNIKARVLKNCYKINSRQIDYTEKKYILWVARCIHWKQPNLFLKIVKKFPQEKFIMISPQSPYEINLFNRIKAEVGQYSNLKFIEKVDFFKTQRYFNRAKLFIGTSLFEGFPNTYLQACMGGTPIVSLKVNSDKFITKNNLGYCADDNFGLMLTQIKNILSNQQDWQLKSKNALKYVAKNHNVEIIGKQWESIIK